MTEPTDEDQEETSPEKTPASPITVLSHPGRKKTFVRSQSAEEGTESWVLTYIDVITLLLSMFVLLLSLSSHNKTGYEKLQDSLKGVVTRPDAKQQSERENIQRKMAEFSAQLKQESLGKEVSYRFEKGKLVVQLGEKILFPSAGASLNNRGYKVLQQLIPVLNDTQSSIVIEGHTDNIPISNNKFASNWELSAARAANVVRYLSEHGIAPVRLSAVGLADTHPIADNGSAEGRARNRRVTFKISYKK